ncbi:hypothetical protein GCM10009037_07800 [Halarchaeum grantii]|uniref:Uncharacterized protein n=1 Tax=Halarchaeum grantii TaxID=1193105 RepID=A0A830EZZ0_9EURY|nr:hypothetical protein GCM10009037_07800 [Halarchaeum grantii]
MGGVTSSDTTAPIRIYGVDPSVRFTPLTPVPLATPDVSRPIQRLLDVSKAHLRPLSRIELSFVYVGDASLRDGAVERGVRAHHPRGQ